MEDQPSFFFNQAEHDTDEDQEKTSDLTEKKKKKGKLASVWDKLFDSKEEKQPETEQKSFLKAFELLFSKLTGVEKEDVQENSIDLRGDRLPSMKMPLVDSIELTSINNNVEDEEVSAEDNYSEHSEPMLNINHDIELEYGDSINPELNEENIINDNEVLDDNTADNINTKDDAADFVQVFESKNTDALQVDSDTNINWQDNENVDQLDNTNTGFTEPEKVEAEIKNAEYMFESGNNKELIVSRTRAALAGDVAAEKLNKTNRKLRNEVKKINDELRKQHKKEKQDRGDIKNLYKANRHQKQENDRLKDRLDAQESSQAVFESNLQKPIDNTQSVNKKENTKKEPENNFNNQQNYVEPNKETPALKNINNTEKTLRKDLNVYKNVETTKNQLRRDYQPIGYEQFNELENNKNTQKQPGNYEKISEDSSASLKIVDKNRQIKTLPIQSDDSRSLNVKSNQINTKNVTQNRYLKPEKYYKEAMQQGFAAGIIMLVSLGLIVFVWSLIN